MSRISIVIPTLNAAEALQCSLPPLAAFGVLDLIREVILADGGSTDKTAAIAEAAGARMVAADPGRGPQLVVGAESAGGDWLLFLHADTALSPGWDDVVRGFIADPGNIRRAACFRLAFDDSRLGARRIAWLANLRSRVLGLPYGDQGLLISRAFYRALGGFRPISLMEDVDLARRVGWRRLTMLKAVATTSAARYRRDGFWLRPARNLFCLALWFLGVPPRTIARLYG